MVQVQAWAFHPDRTPCSPHLALHGLPGTLDAARLVGLFASAVMRFTVRP
jgi:hypothetical protein